jgi:hypothetical protein
VKRPLQRLALLMPGMLALCALLFISGCASFYVDGTAGDVDPAGYRKTDAPRAVQVLFEFQTKGVPNGRATTYLKSHTVERVTASGLFSTVSDKPVPGEALLSITIDNVPITDNAFQKGFVTGLTFGLAGSVVTDGYVCTVQYRGGTDATPIEKRTRHAIHTAIGASRAPPNATRAKNSGDAVMTMTRQIVDRALQDLSQDPDFR